MSKFLITSFFGFSLCRWRFEKTVARTNERQSRAARKRFLVVSTPFFMRQASPLIRARQAKSPVMQATWAFTD